MGNARPKQKWDAVYEHKYNGKDANYTIRFDLEECPVSFIPDGAPELINILTRQKTMGDVYHARISDQPLDEWEGKLVEALELLEQCRIEEHNARVMAEIDASRQK